MVQTIGVGMIVRNSEATIEDCIRGFIDHVDQCSIILAGESKDKTVEIVQGLAKEYPDKIIVDNFTWIEDFAAARNFSFSKLKADWLFWCDSDDVVSGAENLRKLAENAGDQVGCIWFSYHYAVDEYGNPVTIYERERLLRTRCGWIWRGRLHETLSCLNTCQFVRSDEVIILHRHGAGESRSDRNFRILEIMYKENPEDRRIWLYLGHQNFAARNYFEAAKWYLKFGTDEKAVALERYQALCYCSKAMRELKDTQAADVAFMAVALYPQFKDGYIELANSYLAVGDWDKAIHFANLSEVKDLMVQPPAVIFINPLDYTFNRYALMSQCHAQKGNFKEAREWMVKAYEVRPSSDVKAQVDMFDDILLKERVGESIKVLAVHLLNNKEYIKLPSLLGVAPYWYRDTPDYQALVAGIKAQTNAVTDKPEIVEAGDGKVIINIGECLNPEATLAELDKKYSHVTVIAPMPGPTTKQWNAYSQTDIEGLLISREGRQIISLQREPSRIFAEYKITSAKPAPDSLTIRIYLGQGLEFWSPKTIKEVGCGGSETAMAMLAKELTAMGNQSLIYAMDNEVWDGVIYRPFNRFNAETLGTHHLFISSRIPELFDLPILAKQKWLWVHDVHCWDRLTPDTASKIDVIVALSHWHVDHLKRVYPFLKDAEVIDLDDQDKTYEDTWTGGVYYQDEIANRLPKLAIIGNALDVTRFENITEERVPHRFIWCSSPDRGLEQVLDLCPMIREMWPDATLKIYYGWDYFDKSLSIPGQQEFKNKLLQQLKQDGVEWCGRIGQVQLVHELFKSSVMLYPPPHTFRETYGIAFLEAQAAGVICVYRQNGALGETIGDRGISLSLDATKEDILAKLKLVDDVDLCDKLREKGKLYAQGRTWRKQAEKVIKLYHLIEEQKNG